jgi:hypothetical protein
VYFYIVVVRGGVLLHVRGGVLLLGCFCCIHCCWSGTTCIYVSSIGALHIEMLSCCCMWMVNVDDKCVWWIHTCDIWNWMVDELWHNWICDLMILCIGEIWWMLWLCGLVYMYIGGFCWWLWNKCSNCMSYLLCLYTWWIYLMIIGWMIMMRWELYMYIHKMWWFLWWWWLIACNLKWWIVLVELSMLNE